MLTLRRLAGLSVLLVSLVPGPAGALSPWAIFFDLGSDRVFTRFASTLDNIVEWHRNVHVTRFRVTGFADTSGAADTNLRLSLRRAEAVRAALVDRGVPADVIRVEVRGEIELLVDTPDGVPHFENRRVYIVVECMRRPPAGMP
jgi:outer membrane protein OmpA-like peptidoglycan-associated protein